MANDKDTAQETHAPMLQWRDIAKLIQADETPCVSIYVPTTPVSSHREEMRIAYKDQIKKIQAVLDEREMDAFVMLAAFPAMLKVDWRFPRPGILYPLYARNRFLVGWNAVRIMRETEGAVSAASIGGACAVPA